MAKIKARDVNRASLTELYSMEAIIGEQNSEAARRVASHALHSVWKEVYDAMEEDKAAKKNAAVEAARAQQAAELGRFAVVRASATISGVIWDMAGP